MAIGTSLDLDEMLSISLTTLLRKLSCSAGAVYTVGCGKGPECAPELMYSIPRTIERHKLFAEVLSKLPEFLELKRSSTGSELARISGSLGDDGHYHIVDLPGFGVLVLLKSGNDIGPLALKALQPLSVKLANACRACVQQQERYRQMFENMTSGVAVYRVVGDGEEFIFEDFNRAAEEMDTVNRSDVVGKSVLEVFPGVREFGLFDVFKRVWSTGQPERHPISRYKDDRIAGWRENYVYKLPTGEIVAIYDDVTERKRAEEELRESEEKYRDLFENANDLIQSVGPDMKFQYVNRAWKDALGYTEEEVKELTLMDIICPDDMEHCMETFKEIIDGGEAVGVEVKFVTKDGRLIDVEGNVNCRVENGIPVATRGVFRDITERKRAEERIERYAEQLEALNKELEAFSYSVSHDLRAPLRSIDGFSQALLDDYSDKVDDQGRDYLKRVRAAAQSMAQLIDDMLKLSRVTKGEMRRESVSLSGIAGEIASGLAVTEPGRKVEFEIEPGLEAVGDPALLRVLLENLLDNAWKFTSKNDTARIEFGIADVEGKKAFYVRDNGVGFDMAYADKLFIPFQRLHNKTEFLGTGIGLATAQRITRRHGGSIWAEGKVGEGVTFYFRL